MIATFLIFMAAIFGFLGLLIGSFINVCVYRLPRGESVVVGRSHCPSCGHVLSPKDLIPVLSYLALGRRCRYCHFPISGRYAVIETLTGFLYASAGMAWVWIGLALGWSAYGFLLAPLLHVAIISIFWTWFLLIVDRKTSGKPLKTSLRAPVMVALLTTALQLAVPLIGFK